MQLETETEAEVCDAGDAAIRGKQELRGEVMETIGDVVKEIREIGSNPILGVKTDREKELEKFLKDILLEYADRIEHANKEMSSCLNDILVVLGEGSQVGTGFHAGDERPGMKPFPLFERSL
ncbi:MAG: hypothetical protein MJZ81_11920 [Bacteroidales bacterium]|nr:hypothetical protein [Bacteroidales bacterium]